MLNVKINEKEYQFENYAENNSQKFHKSVRTLPCDMI